MNGPTGRGKVPSVQLGHGIGFVAEVVQPPAPQQPYGLQPQERRQSETLIHHDEQLGLHAFASTPGDALPSSNIPVPPTDVDEKLNDILRRDKEISQSIREGIEQEQSDSRNNSKSKTMDAASYLENMKAIAIGFANGNSQSYNSQSPTAQTFTFNEPVPVA